MPSGPDCRRSSAGSRTSRTAPTGTARSPRRSPSTEPDLVVSAGFMKLVGKAFLAEFGGPVRQHPPRAEPGVPRHARRRRRAGVRRQGHRLHDLLRRRRRRHRPDRGPGRGAGSRTTTRRIRCTSGSRSPSERCSSTRSARWRAEASPSRTGRSALANHHGVSSRFAPPQITPWTPESGTTTTGSRSSGRWSRSTTRPGSRSSPAACTRRAWRWSPPAARPR